MDPIDQELYKTWTRVSGNARCRICQYEAINTLIGAPSMFLARTALCLSCEGTRRALIPDAEVLSGWTRR